MVPASPRGSSASILSSSPPVGKVAKFSRRGATAGVLSPVRSAAGDDKTQVPLLLFHACGVPPPVVGSHATCAETWGSRSGKPRQGASRPVVWGLWGWGGAGTQGPASDSGASQRVLGLAFAPRLRTTVSSLASARQSLLRGECGSEWTPQPSLKRRFWGTVSALRWGFWFSEWVCLTRALVPLSLALNMVNVLCVFLKFCQSDGRR